jgi:hypothetical protein
MSKEDSTPTTITTLNYLLVNEISNIAPNNDAFKIANACEKIALSFAINCQIELLERLVAKLNINRHGWYYMILKKEIESLTNQLNNQQ